MPRTRTILITGFEPFGGDRRNPSAEIAQALEGRQIGGRKIVGAVLPCVFGKSRRILRGLVRKHRPELVICLGLAATRPEITPERVAINVDDARIPDNAGQQPVDRSIVRGGPTAYGSTLPIKAMVAAIERRGIAASVSSSAGTFVCNHVFYGLLHDLRRNRSVRGGFVHVPWPMDWGGDAASKISFAEMVTGIEEGVRAAARRRPKRRKTENGKAEMGRSGPG